jgi:hypothetical protein
MGRRSEAHWDQKSGTVLQDWSLTAGIGFRNGTVSANWLAETRIHQGDMGNTVVKVLPDPKYYTPFFFTITENVAWIKIQLAVQ